MGDSVTMNASDKKAQNSEWKAHHKGRSGPPDMYVQWMNQQGNCLQKYTLLPLKDWVYSDTVVYSPVPMNPVYDEKMDIEYWNLLAPHDFLKWVDENLDMPGLFSTGEAEGQQMYWINLTLIRLIEYNTP